MVSSGWKVPFGCNKQSPNLWFHLGVSKTTGVTKDTRSLVRSGGSGPASNCSFCGTKYQRLQNGIKYIPHCEAFSTLHSHSSCVETFILSSYSRILQAAFLSIPPTYIRVTRWSIALYCIWWGGHCFPMHCDLLRSIVLPRIYVLLGREYAD